MSYEDTTVRENAEELAKTLIGKSIVSAQRLEREPYEDSAHEVVLNDGTKLRLVGHGDCCAFAMIDNFWLDPASVDHVITGVRTENGDTIWHILAGVDDVMRLEVDWSEGSGYYSFGIEVREVSA